MPTKLDHSILIANNEKLRASTTPLPPACFSFHKPVISVITFESLGYCLTFSILSPLEISKGYFIALNQVIA